MLGKMRTAREKVHIRIIGTEVWLWVTINYWHWFLVLWALLKISRGLYAGFISWLCCTKLYKLGTLKHQKMFSHCFGGQKPKVSWLSGPSSLQGTREEPWPAPASGVIGNLWHLVACGSSLWSQLSFIIYPSVLHVYFPLYIPPPFKKLTFWEFHTWILYFHHFHPPVYPPTPSVSACLLLLKLITFSSIMIAAHTYTHACINTTCWLHSVLLMCVYVSMAHVSRANHLGLDNLGGLITGEDQVSLLPPPLIG